MRCSVVNTVVKMCGGVAWEWKICWIKVTSRIWSPFSQSLAIRESLDDLILGVFEYLLLSLELKS